MVKLDRCLIAGVDRSPRLRRLVGGLIHLVADMGALVLAEGVETADELAAVRDLGIDLVRGHVFARPGFPLPPIAAVP